MILVLDTNVLVSAIQFGGKPRAIFDLVIDKEVKGIITEEIVTEVRKTLSQKFLNEKSRLDSVEDILCTSFTKISIKKIPTVARDPKDNHILAITHATNVDYVISGDKDLLTLKFYNSTPIISPAHFLKKYSYSD